MPEQVVSTPRLLMSAVIGGERDLVRVRQRARDLAAALGFPGQDQVRIATAVSEVARNAVHYAGGGVVDYLYEMDRVPQRFLVRVRDEGQGIKNLDQIFSGSYRSSTGLGKGLIGARRVMDHFSIVTDSSSGTLVEIGKDLPSGAGKLGQRELDSAVQEVVAAIAGDPLEEVQRQNRELIHAFSELRSQQETVERLAAHLTILDRVGQALARSLDTLQLLEETVRALVPTVADSALAGLVTEAEEGVVVECCDEDGQAAVTARRFRAADGPAFSLGEARVVSDPAELTALLDRVEGVAELPEGIHSAVLAPLLPDAGPRGWLLLVRHLSSEGFNDDEGRLAGEVAQRCALALEKAHLYTLAQRATQLREQVLGIVAHDLRGPLMATATAAEIVRRSQNEAQRDRQVEIIRRSVSSMQRLILDLLDASAIEGGSLAIEPEPMRLESCLEEAAERFRDTAASKQIGIELDLAPVQALVNGDRERLLQVLGNLLHNAIKHSATGGRIVLGTASGEGEILCRVSDEGSGMDGETQARIFDRFWRGRDAQEAGAGLGLAIAQGIIEAHAGRIWVESELGRGSTFWFALPVWKQSTKG